VSPQLPCGGTELTKLLGKGHIASPCIGNPVRRAARDARKTYILELMSASYRGEDVDREAEEWLNRLNELCGPHAEVEDIARWYQLEKVRLQNSMLL
jgi:hypothetical protein